MTTDSTTETAEVPGDDSGGYSHGHRHRRRWLAAGGVAAVAVVGGGIAAGAVGAFSNSQASGQANVSPPALGTITLGTLSSTTDVSGTLGYASSYNVSNQASGIYTWLPAPGQVIKQGDALYEVSGEPVVLLYGSVPAYRTLSQGDSGKDVKQLNADLVALRYATSSKLDPTSDSFSQATATALEGLQAHLGVTQTGTLTLGQAVFLPSEARINSVQANPGSPAGRGTPVLSATSTTRQVTVHLQATEQSYVSVGDKVSITLANNSVTTGAVTSVGKVARQTSGSSTPTVTVEITPSQPSATGSLDSEPVQVAITTASVKNALAVPVTALLAVPGAGYQLQVAEPGGRYRLVPVTLGLFDDAAGTVLVTGPGLHAGEKVGEGQ